jgi:hypothetical protein
MNGNRVEGRKSVLLRRAERLRAQAYARFAARLGRAVGTLAARPVTAFWSASVNLAGAVLDARRKSMRHASMAAWSV